MQLWSDEGSAPRLNAEFSMQLSSSQKLAGSSIALLERIDVSGSITQAAKDCGISYRSAWQLIERLQNSSANALITRSAGGVQGGGSRLTNGGRELIRIYRMAEIQHSRFVELLGEAIAEYETYTTFMRRWFMKTSVRNQLYGSVQLIAKGAVNSEVVVEIGGSDPLTAIITNDGANEMNLSIGKEVAALVRESSIFLCAGESMPNVSARNRLKGRVLHCCEGVVCSEVTVELSGGKAMTAMISFESMAEMKLWPDSPVWVCFKASDVILAGQL